VARALLAGGWKGVGVGDGTERTQVGAVVVRFTTDYTAARRAMWHEVRTNPLTRHRMQGLGLLAAATSLIMASHLVCALADRVEAGALETGLDWSSVDEVLDRAIQAKYFPAAVAAGVQLCRAVRVGTSLTLLLLHFILRFACECECNLSTRFVWPPVLESVWVLYVWTAA